MVAVVGAAASVLGVVAVTQVLDRTEAWDAATEAGGGESDVEYREVDGPPDYDCLNGEESMAYLEVVQEPSGESAPPPPPRGVIRAESGLTLGRDEPYADLDGERPDMVYVVGDDDVAGYARAFELADIGAFGGRISPYAADTQTPVGTYTSPDGVGYPVNENGQTYGSSASGRASDDPDLVAVLGNHCKDGYVRSELLRGEESLADDANRNEPDRWFEVDVTESDGVTVVDTYTISRISEP